MLPPDTGTQPEVHVNRTYRFNRLVIEELCWKLPYGPETEAVFLKPENSAGPLPGIMGFHDHGGIKYFGKQKIIQTGPDIHPIIKAHRQEYYGGTALANDSPGKVTACSSMMSFPLKAGKYFPRIYPPMSSGS